MPNRPLDPVEQARADRHAANQAKAAQALEAQEQRQASARAKAFAAEQKKAALGLAPDPTAAVAGEIRHENQAPAVTRYTAPARLPENVTREQAFAAGITPWTSPEERAEAYASPLYKDQLRGEAFRRACYARDAVTD